MNLYQFKFSALILCLVTCNLSATEPTLGFYRSKGLYVQGTNHCLKLLNKTQKNEERKKIMLELAACYQFNTRDHTYLEAVETYKKFIKDFPDDPLCAKVFFNIGRCYDAFTMNRKRDIVKARAAYKTCYEKYPSSQWADQAYFWNANSYIYKLTPKTAKVSVGLFKQFLKLFPNSFLTGVVHSQLSELNCAWLNNYALAVKHSEAALKYGIQDVNLRRLHLYRIGYLYQFKLGNNKQALKWYKILVADSPMKSDPNYFVAIKRIRELQPITGGGK
jgi:outer membrane protein assembly factor BamD (BamD/ComL family)